MSEITFTGGPEISRQVEQTRANIRGEIYSTKYSTEITGEIIGLGLGMTLLCTQASLNISRKGRNRFNTTEVSL